MNKEINIRKDLDYSLLSDYFTYKEANEYPSENDRTSDLEEDKIKKASILIRNVIHNHLITENYQWLERLVEENPAPGREQIYEWTNNGHREAYFWLKKRGIENPKNIPNKNNTRDLFKLETTMWLMHRLNGKKLDKRLEELQFTIPLIAEELLRLKY